MSVYAENLAIAYDEMPADFLRGRWANHYLVALIAGRMRQFGQDVYPDPENQDASDSFRSHSAVRGHKDNKTRKRLGENFQWIVAPSALEP